MTVRQVEIAGIGTVSLVKSRTNRNLRLSVTSRGVRVSMPWWSTYQAGMQFADRHRDWIFEQRQQQQPNVLTSGSAVGKTRTLVIRSTIKDTNILSRLHPDTIEVLLKRGEQISNPLVQTRIDMAVRKALRAEAEALLPTRLRQLADKHAKTYHSVSIKHLKRRWGSCSSQRDIVLNLYLMQLPWEQIDYVLLHELAHTEAMNHGPGFWRLLLAMEPRARALSQLVRRTQPK